MRGMRGDDVRLLYAILNFTCRHRTISCRSEVRIGAGLQIQWEVIKDRFVLGAQGMPFL
jgi:hypothetical protein